jgi:hypothetical protein
MSRASYCIEEIKWRMTSVVWGFYVDEYSERDLQDYNAVQLGIPVPKFWCNLPPPTSLETDAASFAQNFRNYQPVYALSYLHIKFETFNWKACDSNLGSSSFPKKILEFYFKTFQYTLNSINTLLCVFLSLLPGISDGGYASW